MRAAILYQYLRPCALNWREGSSGPFENEDNLGQTSLDTFVCDLERSGKAGSYAHESKSAWEVGISILLPYSQPQLLGPEKGNPINVLMRECGLPQRQAGLRIPLHTHLPTHPPKFLSGFSSPRPFSRSRNQDHVEAGAGVATMERKDLFLLVGL